MELDMFGPRVKLLTTADTKADDFILLKGTIPPGAVIKLHSHLDREVFYILSGEIEVYLDGQWEIGRAGSTLDISINSKHAFRNTSNGDAVMVTVTTRRLADFFLQVGRPIEEAPLGPPTSADLERFVQAAKAGGHWLASPEENAAIGL